LDTLNPNVLTQNVTVYLDASGAASITTADVDNGSNDNCTVVSLSLSKTTNFDCSEVGANTVKLYVTDANNNVDSATATVTVSDTIKPTVATQAVTVYLDGNGAASITTTDVDNGTSDNCSVVSLSLSKTSFTCADVGANTVQLIATDVNGNIDSTSTTITVSDTIRPSVVTQAVTVYLDGNGAASISTADIDNGSADNCSIQTQSLNTTNFTCSDVGANTVTLTVTDVNSNVNTATATVTVLDTLNPMISGCPTNINQVIDAGNCTAIVTWSAPTAADNCTVDSLVSSHIPGDVFALGTTTVTYIAYDPELNTDTCTFTVTVTDNEDPVIKGMPSNITMDNDSAVCGAVVTWATVSANDNCSMDSLRSTFQSGETFPIGTTTVTYTAYDANGNTSAASFTITVSDTTKPEITCPADIAQCDSIVNFMDATATDNCGIASIVRTDATGLNTGDQFPLGTTTISYLVTDVNGNQESCSFTVEVYTPPTANAGEDVVTRDIEPIQLLASSTNAASFRWTPAFSVAIDTVEQPMVNPQMNTTYTMEVTSPDGCVVTDDVEVAVNVVTKLDATTLFSPNGDGRNDTWVVNKPALIKGCRLIIVNRNGTEVYSTSDYNNEWDGTISGSELPEGTYYYVFDCPDGRTLSGPITILRERR
jgi:gliding motility-associated-like protein